MNVQPAPLTEPPLTLDLAGMHVDVPADIADLMKHQYEALQERFPNLYSNFAQYVVAVLEGGIYGES